MIPRDAEDTLRQLAKGYPVLAITGPRQSGKTTLVRAMVDLLIEQGGNLLPIEVKSGATLSRDALAGLTKWQGITGQTSPRPRLIYGGDEVQHRSEFEIIGWKSLTAAQASTE